MNMKDGITEAQVRKLLATANDAKTNHVLWVHENGSVHLDIFDETFILDNPRERFRYETYVRGNGYTGKAVSDEWVAKLTQDLQENWASGDTGLLDY